MPARSRKVARRHGAGHLFDSAGLRDAGAGCATANLTTTLLRTTLPPLTRLGTFPEWVAQGRGGLSPLLYTQAFAAVEFLIARHGAPAVLDYFSRFAASQDREGNFERAFGETRQQFEQAFRRDVWRK